MPSIRRNLPFLTLSGFAVIGMLTACQAPTWPQGNLLITNKPLDLAIDGPGFFAVTQPSGQLAYTRHGAFVVDESDRLKTASGSPLSPPVVIAKGTIGLTLRRDGTFFGPPPGSHEQRIMGNIMLARFPNPVKLLAIGDRLYSATLLSGAPSYGQPTVDGLGALRQGALEAL